MDGALEAAGRTGSPVRPPAVSILVLVDGALEVRRWVGYLIDRDVSILVLVDGALEEKPRKPRNPQNRVSILVLVDGALEAV